MSKFSPRILTELVYELFLGSFLEAGEERRTEWVVIGLLPSRKDQGQRKDLF